MSNLELTIAYASCLALTNNQSKRLGTHHCENYTHHSTDATYYNYICTSHLEAKQQAQNGTPSGFLFLTSWREVMLVETSSN